MTKPIFKWLLGDDAQPFLYIHHGLLLAGVLMLLSAGIFNLVFQTAHPFYAWLLIVMSPINLLIWYRSRWRGEFNAMAIVFVLLVSAINLPLNWVFNAGSDGPTMMFYFAMLLYLVVLLPNLRFSRYLLTALILLMPVVLISLESVLGDWIYRYPDDQARLIDLSFSYIVVALVLLLIMAAYGKMYRLERDRAHDLALKLENLANRDSLTGLYNRRALKHLYEQWPLEQDAHSLALVDLDHFKQLNDQNGHGYGDEVLQHFAQQFEDLAEQTQGVSCRHGGEEFILVFKQPLEQAKTSLEALLNQVQQSPLAHGVTTFSAGLVELKKDETLEQAIQRADQCMYQAKYSGRNQICSASHEEQV